MAKHVFSKKVKIEPWVGKDYLEHKPRILILGESYYINTPDVKLVHIIENIRDGGKNHSFFTKIGNIFSDADDWDEISLNNFQFNRASFWDSIAFTDYIQVPLQEPREKVDPALWEEAKEPFEEVLNVLKPDIVLALGRTYDNLPEKGTLGGKINVSGKSTEYWVYSLNGHQVKVLKVQHPSSFKFSQDVWLKIHEKFLSSV